jgi:NAD(P)-dependent dehydrogenase (short-subunit alcohol dehydrogenase family)
MTSIKGKVVAITGGARGIGLATATTLHGRGARVAIGDIDDITLKESATTLGIDAYAKLDVTDEESFEGFLNYV